MKGKTGVFENVSMITKIALIIALAQQLCVFVDGASKNKGKSLRAISSTVVPCTQHNLVEGYFDEKVKMGHATIETGPVSYWTDSMTECSFLVLVGRKQDDGDDDGCVDMSNWGLDAKVLAALQADCPSNEPGTDEVEPDEEILSMATHVQGSELKAPMIKAKTTYVNLIKELLAEDWQDDTVKAQIYLGSDGYGWRQGANMARELIKLGINYTQITAYSTEMVHGNFFVGTTTYDEEGNFGTFVNCSADHHSVLRRGAAGVDITSETDFANGWYLQWDHRYPY
jgi:hypothetical protein